MSLLRMVRGDGRTFTITITDAAGDAVDISDATLAFTARRSYGGSAVIEKVSGDGIEPGVGTGVASLVLDPADTSGLPAAVTDLLWDVEVTDALGVPQTTTRGVLRIDPDLSYTGGS